MLIAINSKEERTTERQEIYNPELARAMTYAQVAEGEEATNSDYVKFDAFFLRDLDGDGVAEEIRGTCKQIGRQDTLYMNLNVNTNGYLKDGKITINGNNFYLETSIPKENENGTIKENAIGLNTKEIQLRDIKNGTQKLLTGFVKSGDYRYESTKAEAIGNNINNYSKVNSVTLTGIHVTDDGTETPIEKTVEFNVEWYGETGAQLPQYLGNYNYDYKDQERDIENIIDEEKEEINLKFDILTKETKNELNISSAIIESEIPQLNGYDPIRVETENAKCEYEPETRKLIAIKSAETDENGRITKNAYTDIYKENRRYEKYTKIALNIVYPLEAYRTLGKNTIEIKMPIKAYYEGYNNTNEEFINPYKSMPSIDTVSVRFKNPDGNAAAVYAYVGKYIDEPTRRYIVSKAKPLKIYNNIAENGNEDTYEVQWNALTGSKGESTGLTLKETKTGEAQVSDMFVKKDGTEESMEAFTNNIGIYFSNATQLLGEDGWIKVYDDETNELIETFTKNTWDKYNQENPYKYEVPIKHIRIETSNTEAEKYISVCNIKELNDNYIAEHYTKEEFEEISYIKSTVVQYLGENYITNHISTANYEAPVSIARLKIEKTAISTQETEKNAKITIETVADIRNNQEKWSNGTFLIKLPEEIITAEINNISISNRDVKISNYGIYEENGSYFINILTENENPENFSITIDCDLTPDPRTGTISRNIELYATNENCENYYYQANDTYDINGNSNNTEIVNYSASTLNLVAPGSLLTSQLSKKYNQKENETIAPKIALISKEQRTATIEVEIKNNYSNTISDIEILGRLPVEGNTYAITKERMGSNFTAKITNAGISIPDELSEHATVYYSEKENTTKELTDVENMWTTEPEDWSKVKSYLITINNYAIPIGKAYKFNYEIEIPEGLNYNQISYSHHGVYFSLDTDEGKYRTQIEPNKLGLMIAKQFNIEVTKYQKDTNKIVPNATYKITEENSEIGNSQITNNEGKALIKNLYVEKTYVIKEIKSPIQYEINNDEIRFTTKVNENGQLEATLISGKLRSGTNLEVKQTEEGYTISIQVEDEVKSNLKLTKLEKETTNTIAKAKFQLTGKGMPESGKLLVTGTNGEALLAGLYINEEYTLTEISAEGYYLANPVKFIVNNNGGQYSLTIKEGKVEQPEITIEDEIPTINISIENEKIPRYTLDITKIKKGEPTNVLAGAKFKLIKGDKVLGEYISDNNGKIVIPDLYRYVDGRDVDCTYTLKEVLAPEGYAKVKDITFKVQEIDGELQFQEEVQAGATAKTYTVDENTIKLIIEDSPSFKLTKKDGTTKELLPGIKFAIYNVDEGEIPAKDSKGNIIGNKEIINGQEYYTITTNENGELTADLKEGLYKAVEIEAPEQYDIEDNIYYFGIGASREPQTLIGVQDIIGSNTTAKLEENIPAKLNEIELTADGGYIKYGYFCTENIKIEENVIDNTNYDKNNFTKDSVIAKYNSENDIEWINHIGGNNDEDIVALIQNQNGYLVAIHSNSNNVNIGSKTIQNSNNEILIIAKYNLNNNLEWISNINGGNTIYDIKENDVGYMILGAGNTLNTEINNINLTRNFILQYSYNGKLQDTKNINDEKAYSGILTNDGGCITLGSEISFLKIMKYDNTGKKEWEDNRTEFNYTVEEIDIETIWQEYMALNEEFNGRKYIDNYILEMSNGDFVIHGMYQKFNEKVIRYSSNGDLKWEKIISNQLDDRSIVSRIFETTDGGVLLKHFVPSDVKTKIIKYSENGNEEINTTEVEIGGKVCETTAYTAIYPTKDGGYIIQGLNFDHGNIIKFNSNFEIEWINYTTGLEFIHNIKETDNEELVIIGAVYPSNYIYNDKKFYSNIDMEIIIKIGKVEIPNIEIKQENTIEGMRIVNIRETTDGGYIAVGCSVGNTITIENENITTNSEENGIALKYDKNGKIEWKKIVENANLEDVIETKDNGYLITGILENKTNVDGIDLNEFGQWDVLLAKYNSNGKIEWATSTGEENNDCCINIINTTMEDYILVIKSESNKMLEEHGVHYDYILERYNKYGELQESTKIEEFEDTANAYIYTMKATLDGGYILGGQVDENTKTYGFIIKYDKDGKKEWIKKIGYLGTESMFAKVSSIEELSNSEFLISGTITDHRAIELGEKTKFNEEIEMNYNGAFIAKYDNKGNLKWIKEKTYMLYELNKDGSGIIQMNADYYGIIPTNKVSFIRNNCKSIEKYNLNDELEWIHIVDMKENDWIGSTVETSDKAILYSVMSEDENGKTQSKICKAFPTYGAQEINELEVENNVKEFNITTSVNEIDEEKGGTISGDGLKSYEKVKYNETNTKEIKMTPNINYEIIKVTVNGEEYPFEVLEDGSFTMPQFTNIMEDKHIEVTYALKDNKIIINKVDSETGEFLTGAKFKIEQIEERTNPENAIENIIDDGESGFTEIAKGQYELTTPIGFRHSYIPINLEGYVGKYNISINIDITLTSGYGRIAINKSISDYYDNCKWLSGAGKLEYNESVEGGNIYYLHLVYENYNSPVELNDKLSVKNVSVMVDSSELYNTRISTNTNGQAITQLPFAKYKITEIQAPEGYYAGEPIEIEFTGDSEHTITIPNTKYAKVTVNHHKAIKNADGTYTDTGEKLAESTTIQGKIGEEYTTAPRLDFEKYELITDIEGKVVIPENYTGNYTKEEQIVTYLYAEKEIPLVVHHYIQDTLLPVPLEDGTTAQEVTESGYEGDNYTTNAIPNEKLSEEYELVKVPSNSTGTYRGNKVEVNYYYKKIERNVNIIKYQEDGQTPLAGAKFTITKIEENKAEDTEPTIYTTDEKGKITIALEAGEYKITEIEAPTGYIIPENTTNTVTITRETTEEKLEITNEKIKGKVIVHHYIKGIDEPVKLEDGTIAQDEIKQKYIGEIYATKPLENIAEEYEYDSVVGQTSGEYTEETIEITYYYKALVDIDVIKKWNHTNNIYGKPENLTVELYSNGEKIQETTMTKANKIEVEGEPLTEETWKYTFERLPKYTDEGTEIEYTISEKK